VSSDAHDLLWISPLFGLAEYGVGRICRLEKKDMHSIKCKRGIAVAIDIRKARLLNFHTFFSAFTKFNEILYTYARKYIVFSSKV